VTPLVLAHRGACWEAPENSLEAFELAIAEGADYVEFDVRAGNGELVICHDPGPPDDVPTLEEVLAALTGRIGLCVEVKEEETADAVLDALERHAVRPEELIVVSFQVGALRRVAERRPEIRCVLHAHEPEEAAGSWGIGFEEPADDGRIAAAQAAGLATTVFTVNAPDRMLELSALGVTGIFTDRPALARQTLQAAR
jgi:glycerophosphoryl diester phosphodiesterase